MRVNSHIQPSVCATCGKEFLPTGNYQKYCETCSPTRRKRAKGKAHAFTINLGKSKDGTKMFWNCTKSHFKSMIKMREALGMSTEFDHATGKFLG